MQGNLKDLIKIIEDKANIVDVISDYITLEKKGNSHVGLCPFHSDSNPSLHVSESKKIFKCFTCGAGGSAINFVQNFEGISFIEAVRKISDKYKIEWKNYLNFKEVKINPEQLKGWQINKEASIFYAYTLKNTSDANIKEYIAKRNLDEESISKFKIGFAVQGKSLCEFLIKKGYSEEEIIKYGLGRRNESGRMNDLFINRLMFPIEDSNGNVVAFSGRIINDNDKYSKYMNSPETSIFKKSETLYNIANARTAANLKKELIVVEGFMDVISLSRKDINNVIATMGTAFTKQHIQLLRNITNNITLAFDSDNAGLNAAISSGKALIQDKINVNVVTIPGGKDFGDLINSTKEKIEIVLSDKKPFLEFYKEKIYLVLDSNKSTINLSKLRNLLSIIAMYDDDILVDINIKDISKKYDIDIDILKKEFKEIKKKKQVVGDPYKNNYMEPPEPNVKPIENNDFSRALYRKEETILIHAQNDIDFLEYLFKLKLSFTNSSLNYIWNELKYSFDNNEPISDPEVKEAIASLKHRLEDTEINSMSTFKEYVEDYQGLVKKYSRSKLLKNIINDKDTNHQFDKLKELKKIDDQGV